jgi:hypothetical protein
MQKLLSRYSFNKSHFWLKRNRRYDPYLPTVETFQKMLRSGKNTFYINVLDPWAIISSNATNTYHGKSR